ncbi:erythromycin esterase family protein [Roseburia rectibacter]|jgi:erythromycin esterase|uniref:erythromycin esterase family protein n=1 Tax=Roseburia rectibacter TaxID=2763062 RepID=UPI00164B2A03|nr:erythromycin esterase family protein [Roseburia rectibacter]UMY98945.1 erythromycin esterase family protein [Roseburia rectibacter]
MKKKKHSRIWAVVGIILLGIVAVGSIYSHFGGFGTGPCADETEFMQYADQVDNIKIPEKTKIVALGEASHGNVEFQQLKLSVFQNLVENAGIRAFALEGDYGGCEYVNRYIHGGEGTAEQAAAAIGFAIYRTDEMADLISYMRKYNETAKAGDDLRFYGFDMQNWSYNLQYLTEACKASGIDVTELKKLEDNDEADGGYDIEEQTRIIMEIKKELQESDAKDIKQADHLADTLLQNISLGKVIDSAVEGNALRDQRMAENVMWILSMEEQRGNACIFISGHNGHIERSGNYGTDNRVMGNILSDELGEGYFAIGTDFYKTNCNLPKSDGKRITHTFYSYDPLAKAAKKAGYDMCWLDFSKVPENSKLKEQITDHVSMGSLGEGYSAFFMSIFPQSYRISQSPEKLYDGMIFVADAHPIEIREE